jgi:protoporphyrinogen oxidase
MNIAIIGAGFTGLAAAKILVQAGHSVTVIEKSSLPGGLAAGFTAVDWKWPLERHYHHVFETDRTILKLAAEIGTPINFYRPLTATYYDGQIKQLDSPWSLLNYSPLGLIDRLRTGIGLAFLKYNPFWHLFENITAQKYITTVMGVSSWKIIWEPLFVGKFGPYAQKISATWFWARIFTRSPRLGYPDEGFEKLALDLSWFVENLGGRILYNQTVVAVTKEKSGFNISFDSGPSLTFDRVLCTLPNSAFTQIAPGLPANYVNRLNSQIGLGAVTLVLALKQKFLSAGAYWLNINDRSMPFLAVVEHTNFIDTSHYHNDNLLYIGNYLPPGHRYFSSTPQDLIREFTPHLQKINPSFTLNNIQKSWVWKTPFAQPVFTPGSASRIPGLKTPFPGLYLANIQQVYPWDRGINYAVELGYKVAAVIQK